MNRRQQEAVVRRTIQEAKGHLTAAKTFIIEVRDYERAYKEAEAAREAIKDLLSDINQLQYEQAAAVAPSPDEIANPWTEKDWPDKP